MKRLWIMYLFAALLVCCTPEGRLGRLLAKHPELRRTDTIHDTVTAIVEYVHTDTVWKVSRDTLRLDKGKLHVRTVIRHDTVWQDAQCDADTIRVPVETIVERVAPVTFVDRIPWWWWLVLSVMALAIIGLIWKR